MDILAHTFWTTVVAKSANAKIEKFKESKIKVGWAAFYGVAPDLFAFGPVFVSIALSFLLGIGQVSLRDLPRPSDYEPTAPGILFIFKLTHQLYSLGHSLVVFAGVFGFVWLIKRKPYYELLGWLFHILIDIPTHSYKFYPTPAFWPLLGWEFNGISWGMPWFMALNYSAIIGISIYYLIKKRRKNHARITRS